MSARSGAGAQGRRPIVVRWVSLCALSASSAFTLACGGENALRGTSIAQADTADQVLDSVYHVITKDGLRQSVVQADTAYYYENSKTFELRGLTVTFFNVNGGQTSVLTSREGTYQVSLGQMEARGDVVVRSTDGRTLNTDLLRYDQNQNQIRTDRPFTFTGPTANGSGVGFVSDPDFRDVTVQQGARGQEKGNGSSGFVIPNQ
ncbi:MAG TPA: LPS export ABC transporter periplasmic protein LptC [Gemmatimonadales bacterium]|nr:LPS export ABC transporter periplasmic protein LptC [Gemmatimonadales bacterium]